MADPIGLIGAAGMPDYRGARPSAAPGTENGAFKDVLLENLHKVNALQQDAEMAVEDLQTGRRADLEGVILATEKADLAFQMVQQMRNKVAQAYDEIKQIRV